MKYTIEQYDSRLPWLKGRRRYIGSSDSAAILGCGYADQTVTGVWRSKVEEVRKEQKRSEATVQLMDGGVLNEPLVIAAFAARHPEWQVDPGTRFDFRVSVEHPFLCASLDSWVETQEDSFPLEAKWILNPSRKIDGEWVNEWDDGKCPIMYQFQVMHQMICTGAKRGCVAAFVRGEYMERWIDRDEELIEWMLGEYRAFWKHVVDRTPPPEKSPVPMRVLRGETTTGTAKLVGSETSDKIREVLEAQTKMERIKTRVGVLCNAIARKSGSAEFLLLDDNQCVKVTQGGLREVKRLPKGVSIE